PQLLLDHESFLSWKRQKSGIAWPGDPPCRAECRSLPGKETLMIEEQLRDLELHEPPLGFDPDAVVDRIERSTKRRRAVTATGVGVTAVLTAVLLVPTLRSSEHPQVVSGAGEPPSDE